jgi:hypothetical protein
MENTPVEYVIEPLVGEVWVITLFPDGHAYAVIDPGSGSQNRGQGEEALLNHVFPEPGAISPGGNLRGEHPMAIPKELADEMRKIQSIEDDVLKQETRPPTAGTAVEVLCRATDVESSCAGIHPWHRAGHRRPG